MLPVEGYTFANYRSMQNIQILTQCGGVNKYVCKYIRNVNKKIMLLFKQIMLIVIDYFHY